MSQNRTDWESLIHELELQIRSGQFDQVRAQLTGPSILNCPRSHAARLSNLARRAQRPTISLKLLQPYVRPTVKGHREASPEERLEYAYALQRLGAKNEAVTMLRGLSAFNKAHLALAFHHISEWDYQLALESLDQFLGGKDLSPYEEVVAQVNRLACMVALADHAAEKQFVAVEKKITGGKSSLLHANVLEIMAQYWTGQGNFAQSRRMLEQAQELMRDQEDVHRLFIEKWTVIAQALESRQPEPLLGLRARAMKLSHWETLRDLDFYQSLIDPGCRWSEWVYFGTPFRHFRGRLEKLKNFPEETWISRNGKPQSKWDPWFPKTGHGELVHRFLAFLTRDFYRPARIAEIFSSLFPDQFYDIEVSPNRIHQVAKRARGFLKGEGIPARLLESDGAYSLRWPDDMAMHVRKAQVRFTKAEFLFDRFRQIEPLTLTSKEWAEKLGFTAEKTKRILKEGAEAGLIEVLLKGQYSKFVLKAT